MGKSSWNQCNEKILKAVEDGVNVVIWFSINISEGPTITNGPDWDCVARTAKTLRDKGYEVTHLISIGGWNAPHPSVKHTPQETFQHFDEWNKRIIARPELGWFGFDGIDWDIEGQDEIGHEFNTMKKVTLDLMGTFSILAKQAGYIVAIAPAESYLDPSTSEFSLELTHPYPEWKYLQPDFRYHGM